MFHKSFLRHIFHHPTRQGRQFPPFSRRSRRMLARLLWAGLKSRSAAARKTALAFEREQRRREGERRKEEAAAAKVRERRQEAIAKVELAIEKAKREHDKKATKIEIDRVALEKLSVSE